MNLDLFEKIANDIKESGVIENFMNELGEYLEGNKSIIEKFQETHNLTAESLDKMRIAQAEILQEYYINTIDEGKMLSIYNKKGDTYLATICDQSKSHEIVKISKNELPTEANVNSVLREKEGKYILDEKATSELTSKIEDKFEEIINDQKNSINDKRIEGHTYEFVEKSGSSIYLIDDDSNSGMSFEELDYNKETFKNAQEGDLFKYENGNYKKIGEY